MRVSSVVRGVKGLFPLIKKHAPASVIALDSFASLPKNTRVAIDATLLVQRLHFASEDFEERHVVGFKRLIVQMRDHDLVPIMVFDSFGKNAQLPAKMREQADRRMRRVTLSMRAHAESRRANRLRSLQTSLQDWQAMSSEEREQVSQRLQAEQLRQQERQATKENKSFLQLIEEEAEGEHSTPDGVIVQMQRDVDELSSLLDSGEMVDVQEQEEAADDLLAQVSALQSVDEASQDADMREVWDEILKAESTSVEEVVRRIRHLRRQFEDEGERIEADVNRASVAQSPSQTLPVFRETPSQKELRTAEAVVYRMLDEGAIIGSIDASQAAEDFRHASTEADTADEPDEEPADPESPSPLSDDGGVEAVEITTTMAKTSYNDAVPQSLNPLDEYRTGQQLEALSDRGAPAGHFSIADLSSRNASLVRSYLKASSPLGMRTFLACAEVCEAEGVPVLWTGDGGTVLGRAHEGEAMASMLVHQGYADVVLSEDSDVVVYGVPLLRKRNALEGGRMELIDSDLARRTLFPPDAALAKDEEMRQAVAGKTLRTKAAAQSSVEEVTGFDGSSAAIDAETAEELTGATSDESSAGGMFPSDTLASGFNDNNGDAAAVSAPSSTMTLAEQAEHASRRQMIEYALLCGTDFSQRIPGLGPETALKLIREFGSINFMRREATRAALELKRAAATQATTATVATRTSKSKAALSSDKSPTTARSKALMEEPPTALKLFPKAIRKQGFRFADDQTWLEYRKTLTAARQVFERPPTLRFQAHKVRHLKRPSDDWIGKAALTAIGAAEDRDLASFLSRSGFPGPDAADNEAGLDDTVSSSSSRSRSTAVRKRRTKQEMEEAKTSAQINSSFGTSPFGDGSGSVASWTPP